MKEKANKLISKTPEGFSKGVNDYLNHFITVTDAKAAALLATNFIILGGLVNINFSRSVAYCYLCSGICCIASILFCCIALYPRLPKSKKGLIFWENIKVFETQKEYLNQVALLTAETLEIEYANQNWLVSKVLSTKNKNVRIGIKAFCISLILLVITFLMNHPEIKCFMAY